MPNMTSIVVKIWQKQKIETDLRKVRASIFDLFLLFFLKLKVVMPQNKADAIILFKNNKKILKCVEKCDIMSIMAYY